jgi:hypothetical protein
MTTDDLRAISDKAAAALREAESDPGASPVLAAVVREFATKATKATELARDDRLWEGVVELEQAGDSAKAAAAADTGASRATTAAVEDAHLAICMLKAELTPVTT